MNEITLLTCIKCETQTVHDFCIIKANPNGKNYVWTLDFWWCPICHNIYIKSYGDYYSIGSPGIISNHTKMELFKYLRNKLTKQRTIYKNVRSSIDHSIKLFEHYNISISKSPSKK